jgi:23S rRNA (adenine2503-C2)-methyltransferase
MSSAEVTTEENVLGMTLEEYAAARGRRRAAVRSDYARCMRTAVLVPERVTRLEHAHGVIKFWLDVGTHRDRSLETESVVIPMRSYRDSSWRTLCVSSQVGCRMGCTFCETGRMGLVRNLSAAEIVQQRLVARQLLIEDSAQEEAPAYHYFLDSIRNVVFMGMGEPLDNLEQVLQAIRVFNDPAGLDIPHSQITVCTVGRAEGIRKLAAVSWPNLRLAISLNAADDALRESIMPVNRGTPLTELRRALQAYPLPPRGRFLIGYVLLKGVNDSLADADAVAAWCRPLPCTVNIIPYNPQRDAVFDVPSEGTITAFMERLRKHGVFVKRRITRGRDLMAACGQLGAPRQPAQTLLGRPLVAGVDLNLRRQRSSA